MKLKKYDIWAAQVAPLFRLARRSPTGGINQPCLTSPNILKTVMSPQLLRDYCEKAGEPEEFIDMELVDFFGGDNSVFPIRIRVSEITTTSNFGRFTMVLDWKLIEDNYRIRGPNGCRVVSAWDSIHIYPKRPITPCGIREIAGLSMKLRIHPVHN